ncbi:MAG TPA: ATP-binding protein [Anaerolineales bacterium]
MAKSYDHLAAEKKVSREVQGEPDRPEIRLDPDRMAQVFGNLIPNSLRCTPEDGKVVLTAWQERNLLVFNEQDNGQGIPAGLLPLIFDRFYRTDPARPPRELHPGWVTVTSHVRSI